MGSIRFAASLLVPLLVSCAVPRNATEALEPSCKPQREFHVVGHGWHTGVVVHARDLQERLPELAARLGAARLVELGWGDAAFYQAPEPTVSLALRAMLYRTATVLHVVAIPHSDPQTYFPGSTVFTLKVPTNGYERLLDQLVGTFERTPDGGLVALQPGLYGESQFYRAQGSFHAFNTCNTWVARAVAATGYPLQNTAVVTADGLLSELRQATDTSCYVTHFKKTHDTTVFSRESAR